MRAAIGIRKLILFILLSLSLVVPVYSLRIVVVPDSLKPGYPISIAVEGVKGAGLSAKLENAQGVLIRAPLFDIEPREIIRGNIVKAALLAVPSTAKSGPAVIKIENDQGLLGEIAISITERNFVSEVIYLDERNTAIRSVPSQEN